MVLPDPDAGTLDVPTSPLPPSPIADRLEMRLNVIAPLVYAAGGLRPGGYGFITSGYGGGVDIDQYDQIRYLDGFVDGLARLDEELALDFLDEINQTLYAMHPDEVTEDNAPFPVRRYRNGHAGASDDTREVVLPDLDAQESATPVSPPLYPPEVLDDEEDDGTMPENVAALANAVVGQRIVSAATEAMPRRWGGSQDVTVITLDNGKRVTLADTDDCCAFTALESFLLHPERVDHMILGVGTTDGYTTWHIYADFGDVMEMKVGWSCGNPFYYGYGFDITVEEIGDVGTHDESHAEAGQ